MAAIRHLEGKPGMRKRAIAKCAEEGMSLD